MKVLILIDSFGRGGAEKSTSLFILKLQELRKDINFICVYLNPYKPGSYEEIERNNIPLIHLSAKGLFNKVKKFRKIIKEYKPDIIHSVLYEANLIKRLASIGLDGVYVESLVNKPYVQEREYQTKSVEYKSKIIKLIDKSTAFLVDHFHSVGFAVAEHYKEIYGPNLKFTVVERGRPVPTLKSKLHFPANVEFLTLVTTARQEYQKGLIYLLEAIIPFKHSVKLRIIGREGSATPQLKEFVKQNHLEDTVHFYGFIENVTEVVAEADVYVSASLFEGLPGSVIEAMSVKKPLLLSDIAEHREVANENRNAIFFKSKDVEGIKKNIKRLLDKEVDLISFGNNSFEIFKNRFTEEAMVKGMRDFYYKIMKLKDHGDM